MKVEINDKLYEYVLKIAEVKHIAVDALIENYIYYGFSKSYLKMFEKEI